MLREDVDYMLSASLLIMFIAFALQLVHRPYMGPAEYPKVRENWKSRTAMISFRPAQDALPASSDGGANGSAGKSGRTRGRGRGGTRTAVQRFKQRGLSGGRKFARWMVNYNTVESILLFC